MVSDPDQETQKIDNRSSLHKTSWNRLYFIFNLSLPKSAFIKQMEDHVRAQHQDPKNLAKSPLDPLILEKYILGFILNSIEMWFSNINNHLSSFAGVPGPVLDFKEN